MTEETNAPWASFPVTTENPGGSHVRANMIYNAWVITCRNCSTYDLVGAGHPAVIDRGDGTHGYQDRTALRHVHATDCKPDESGNYPLDHRFTGVPAPVRPGKLGIIGTQLLLMRAFAMYRLSMAAMGMTDQTLVNTLLKNMLSTSTAATWTPGTGGTALTITPPLHLRLYQVTGTETTTGTEQTGTNGYTTLGSTMGATGFALASAVATQSNQVQWTASGTWANATNGLEVWDTSGTPVRILWGALSAAILANAVVSGDTVTFAASSITGSGANW